MGVTGVLKGVTDVLCGCYSRITLSNIIKWSGKYFMLFVDYHIFFLLVGLRIQEYHQGPWSRALGLEVWIWLGTVFKGLVENIGCFCLVLSQ